MARITVVRSPFTDALAQPVVSLDRTIEDDEGHERLAFEPMDESFWGSDPALKYELSLEPELEN